MIENCLSELLGKRRISVGKLARLSGLHRNTLDLIYHDKTGMISFETLNKICKVLKCNVGDILNFVED